MTLNEYQKKALSTAYYKEEIKIIYPAMGLFGEAGEVAEKIKRVLECQNGDVTPLDVVELSKELGDVLWYVAALAADLKLDLETIAVQNNEKLQSRKERHVMRGTGDNR